MYHIYSKVKITNAQLVLFHRSETSPWFEYFFDFDSILGIIFHFHINFWRIQVTASIFLRVRQNVSSLVSNWIMFYTYNIGLLCACRDCLVCLHSKQTFITNLTTIWMFLFIFYFVLNKKALESIPLLSAVWVSRIVTHCISFYDVLFQTQ